MTDPDITEILNLARLTDPEQASEHLVRSLINQVIGAGYTHSIHPCLVAYIVGHQVSETLAETISSDDWHQMKVLIANLLEQQAHQEAA